VRTLGNSLGSGAPDSERSLPDPLDELGGIKAGAEDFLAAVLQAAAQPIWVVDPGGLIRFANPAAVAALGYDEPGELLGRHSHETIHYKRPDGSDYPAAECPMLLPRTTGETVRSDLDWFFRRDGSMFAVSYVSVPLDMPDGRGAVVAFTDIEASREAMLAEEQASLRRLASLVAGGAPPAEVFATVAREVAEVLHVPLVELSRFDADGAMTVIGAWPLGAHPFQPGTRWPLDGPTLSARIAQTGRPARIDDFAGIEGTIADAVRGAGIRSGAGAPIIVDGVVWGMMATGDERLPEGIEDRLADFTALAATAISNTQAREDLHRLADEQSALRRVATLVARGATPDDVFAAVAREVSRVLNLPLVEMCRYEPDGTAIVIAASGEHPFQTGTRWTLDGPSLTATVRRTGRTARVEDYANVDGAIGDAARAGGVHAGVGAPIVVDGELWGVVSAGADHREPVPADAERRLSEFTELVATAISNATARAELVASRARIVEAADEQRRRVVRDLHDGAQQRLVGAVMTLQQAQARDDLPPAARELVDEGVTLARSAIDELRELAHGIHPAILTHHGLAAAVDGLADRAPLPVDVDIADDRYPAAVESAAYFVAAEALTNVAKYAQASTARVAAARVAGELVLAVEDDGVGGAAPGPGSGLSGLADRVAALDGKLTVDSPPGGGTRIKAAIPLLG
jgi:PAS domain S-box-containing protein